MNNRHVIQSFLPVQFCLSFPIPQNFQPLRLPLLTFQLSDLTGPGNQAPTNFQLGLKHYDFC